MSAATAPLGTRLRPICPARAALQTRLVAALNKRMIDGATLTAELAEDIGPGAVWIRFKIGDQHVWVAPVLVRGRAAYLLDAEHRPDAAAAAAALADVEPLVAALELALGGPLAPDGLDAQAPSDCVVFRLALSGTGADANLSALAAVPAGTPVSPLTSLPLAPGVLQDLPVRWRLLLRGPAVSRAGLARLGAGDLLLLGTGPLGGRFTLPGAGPTFMARVEWNKGTMILEQPTAEGSGGEPRSLEGADSGQPAADWGELRVDTVVEIAGPAMAAADLSTLAAGSVLPIGASGGTLPVRVRAGDRVVAHGELVAIGDGFGVLVARAGERED